MIDTTKLKLIDGLMYALEDIKGGNTPETWARFNAYIENKPFHYSSSGKKCVLAGDLQLYIRIRTNTLKSFQPNKA